MKNQKYLWTAVLVATVVLVLLLAGCGAGTTELTYRVTGTASEATIKYTNADGELEETTANLPWETTLKVGKEFRFTLEVINQSDSGTVTGEALVDGGYLGKADGNTSVYCSGYFSKKGDSLTSAFSSVADTVAPPATPTPIATPTPSASEHMDLGMEYYEQGQFDKAIAEFQSAIELEPGDPDAHRNLGTAYGEQGNWEEAAAAYEQAIELNPDFGEAYGDMVWAYVEMGRLSEAIAAGEKAIELAPDYAAAHNNLGVAYDKQDRLDEAIAEYQEAIRLAPDDALAHNNLGIVYKKQGRLDEAIAKYQEAIRLAPDYAAAHNNLGNAYADQGQLDEAIAEYQEAIRLDPDDASAHINLGIAYHKQGKLDEAVAAFQEAIKIKPDYTTAHLNLGVTYRDLGKSDEAIAEFETYLQLIPSDHPNRKAVEEEIAKLKESAAGQAAEYRNAVGGYSVLYPEGWYYTESETQVEFAESKAAYEAGIEEYPMVLFDAIPLTRLAENLGLAEITDPVEVWEAMAESLDAETGEIEAFEIAGYPTAAADISGTYEGTPYGGGMAIVLVEEMGIFAIGLAPPDQWEAFRPTFATMLNSLSFSEP